MNDTRNKTIDENFNFKDWVRDLKADFFSMAISRKKELERIEKYKGAIKSLKELHEVTASAPVKVQVADFLSTISNSDELEFLELMNRNRPKKKGPKPPWKSHLKLVIYALEAAKGDKFLLGEIQKTLQTQNNSDIGFNKESLYSWSKKISAAAQAELPAFRTVNSKSKKSGPTQWANEMKRAYISTLQKNDKKLRGKKFYFINEPQEIFKVQLKTVIVDE